jgi:4-amino-4-deoxy-L-arabinose transferase-like glycosyltransferase
MSDKHREPGAEDEREPSPEGEEPRAEKEPAESGDVRASEPDRANAAETAENPGAEAGEQAGDDAPDKASKADEPNAPEEQASADEPDEPKKPAELSNAGADRDERAEADEQPLLDRETPLVPEGNPLRYARGITAAVVGSLLAFIVMAVNRPLRAGVPLGALGVLIAAFGILDLIGSFDDKDDKVAHRAPLRDLITPLILLGGASLGLGVTLTLAVAGRLPVAAAAVLAPALFLAAVVGVFNAGERLGPYRLDETGQRRPLLRRHGFWLVVITTLLYLPMLGSHSLSDPWETHYGEVAREILARNDWISLWWAQDGWFWSKPVLDFWIQAIAMSLFGVRFQSGQMLSAAVEGREPWPEWATRLPIFLFTLVATYLLYKAVAKIFGRRAGLLGGVVLSTMPQWFFVAHQTMTDMPFVAAMSAAMACVLLGAHEDPDREARVYEIDAGLFRLRLSAYHLVMGTILVCALPQILYLFSRHLTIDLAPFRVRGHLDAFMSGSPGNCGLPANEACRQVAPVVRGLHPWLQGLVWLQAVGLLLYINWGERRMQRLFFLAAWFFAALATMAKGPAGFGLPVLCALVYLLASKRTKDLLRMEILSGLLILLCVAIPWFVAMYARHGQPFTDRLLFHDMFKRAFTHVHDTNEGDDVSFRYYVWQLGYAMFPWTGLVPAGLLVWLKRREADDPKADASVFLGMWFLFAFALFSLMLTKFHHYILPALPPAAMLTGVLLDELWTSSEKRAAAAAAAGAQSGLESPDRIAFTERFDRVLLGAAAVAGALIVLLVGRDIAAPPEGMIGQIRLLHLFTYNYRRAWPPSLDFSFALKIFMGVAAALTLLLVIPRARRVLVPALAAASIVFAAWGLDVYFVKTSPHWGQRELILAYHRASREVPGPIIAYQMNWKGENFYTGNRVPAFVTSGKKFQDYILEEKKKGAKTFYFLTEHGRSGTLSNELGTPRFFDKLTTTELNNKFVLVRARFE